MKLKYTKKLCKSQRILIYLLDSFQVPNNATISCTELGHKSTSTMVTGDNEG